jgi:hypothetical protein
MSSIWSLTNATNISKNVRNIINLAFLDQIKTILSFFKDSQPTYAFFSATIQHPV